ncbi:MULTISPECIES: DUF2280 domain-containing protein [unclassified Serratia (in: enterobacteria)]|uniref:DUF2280 domain-containing protein n=1 Tax=unclassified Serratia (in: enterobacteria) TaxID=2647522 RepID=UPI0009DEEF64|nr:MULTISPECIES: DUF2280 domain-containing protein [unclassified Serratia (in: enterobacteria)]
MATLPTEVKAFIVQALACFDTPTQVVKAVQAEFNLNITRQQVESHDPNKANGKKLGQKWIELFHFTRERLQNEIADIPIAHKACRLRSLDRMVAQAESAKNYGMGAQLIEQAAKEVGNAYTSQQKRVHSKG